MDCIAYKDGFTEREYYVMIECEHNGKHKKELSEQLQISLARVRQIYDHAKRKQVQLYRKAVYDATKKPPYNERAMLLSHNGSKEIAAFLEREYKDILTTYRNGEPESPYVAPKYMFGMYVQPYGKLYLHIFDISEYHRLTHLIQPFINQDGSENKDYRCTFRIVLYHSEFFVLIEKEKNRKSFEEIGLQFGVSTNTIHAIYTVAKLVDLQNKVAEICKILDKRPYEIISEMDEIDLCNWKKKGAYIKQSYGRFLSQIPKKIAVYKDEKTVILDCYWNNPIIQEAVKREKERGNKYNMFFIDENYEILL